MSSLGLLRRCRFEITFGDCFYAFGLYLEEIIEGLVLSVTLFLFIVSSELIDLNKIFVKLGGMYH